MSEPYTPGVTETISVEAHEAKKMRFPLKDEYRMLLQRADNPDGITIRDIQPTGGIKSISQVARALWMYNLLARFSINSKSFRYFRTYAAMKAYMDRKGVHDWISRSRIVAADGTAKTAGVTFAKDAKIDMSQAKFTRRPPPPTSLFTSVYDPNERGLSHRYYNNLSNGKSA